MLDQAAHILPWLAILRLACPATSPLMQHPSHPLELRILAVFAL